MEELLKKMLDEAKNDKKALRNMKELAVKNQQYELAANLREWENKLFPLSDEQKEAHKTGRVIAAILSMTCQSKINSNAAWLINETIKSYNAKGGQFSIDDASELRTKAEQLFEE